MPNKSPQDVWGQVAKALRVEIGEGPFSSYLEQARVREGEGGALYLVTTTAYACDWVDRNALRRINELWLAEDIERRCLKARARADYEAENPDAIEIGVTPMVAQPTVAVVAADGPRAVRAAGLQERLTFDTFVSGRGNEFALTIARQVASWSEGPFNPVFFCGPYGYGKTHLLNAIAWEAQRLRPDAKVVYLTAERFLSAFLRALKDKSIVAFKDELRGADLLLLDDVDRF